MDNRAFSDAANSLRAGGIKLEEWLQVDASLIRQWESGERRIPAIRVRQIGWLLRQAENDRKLRDADLMNCAWNAEAQARLETRLAELADASAPRALIDFSEELTKHIPSCDICAANEDWKRKHLVNNGAFPQPGFLGHVINVISRVPRPLVPAAVGAALLGGVVALRVIAAAALLIIRFPGVGEALAVFAAGALAVFAAAVAGAAGGLVIPVVRPVLRPIGTVGDYLTGVCVVEAYMFALVLLSPIAFGEPMLENAGDWEIVAIISAFFGLFGAYAYRRREHTDQQQASV